MDLVTATPVEIDTRAAELDAELHKLRALHTARMDRLHGQFERWGGRKQQGRKVWTLSDDEIVDMAWAKATEQGDDRKPWEEDFVARLEEISEIETKTMANEEAMREIQAEYERRPWTRYVTVAGGHIHSGVWCAGGSIRPTTVRQWTPSLSGTGVADAVAQLGPLLCSHCFPSAPVEWIGDNAKPKAAHCAGSGKSEVSGSHRRGGSAYGWGVCQGCGTGQNMTSRGLIRAHRPK